MENEFLLFTPKAEGTAEVRRNGVVVWADGTGPTTPPPAKPQEDDAEEWVSAVASK